MLTFFFISVLAIALLGLGFYLWRSDSSHTNGERVLPPPPDFAGLFPAEEFSRTSTALPAKSEALNGRRQALLARASQGEKATLIEARADDDPHLYDETLNVLVAAADSDPKLLSLVSYVLSHDGWGVSMALARRVFESWKQDPGRAATSKMLHIAARANDAKLLDEAIEAALDLWRQGRLRDVSATELWSLCNGEFWTLSSDERNSGAGFVLKRTLAKCQRELRPATNH